MSLNRVRNFRWISRPGFFDEDLEGPPQNDVLTYAGTWRRNEGDDPAALPAWFVLNEETGVATLRMETLQQGDTGTHTLFLSVTDRDGLSAAHEILLVVASVGVLPEAPTTLAPAATEGEAASWDARTWFVSAVAASTLTFEMRVQAADGSFLNGLDWLDLNGTTGLLTIAQGATDDPEVGLHTLVVTATDPQTGDAVSHRVVLPITGVPDLRAPFLNYFEPLSPGGVVLGLENFFVDNEEGPLTFSYTKSAPSVGQLPVVEANLENRVLTLNPGRSSIVGAYEALTISVTDSDGNELAASFLGRRLGLRDEFIKHRPEARFCGPDAGFE